MKYKSSIYCYLFNAIKYNFNYLETFDNFLSFADEVVCATIPCEDDTNKILKDLNIKNLNVIESDIKLSNNRFDGLLKTEALQYTENPIKIIADCDERFVLSQKNTWNNYYESLLNVENIDGIMVPVIDLWGDKNLIRSDCNIGLKFRVHKNTIVKRDVLPAAELENGLFNTSISDSTEPQTVNNKLGVFARIVDNNYLIPQNSYLLNGFPYVIHEGYLSFENRLKINKTFWKEKWEERSGHEENVLTDEEKLNKVPVCNHNLSLI